MLHMWASAVRPGKWQNISFVKKTKSYLTGLSQRRTIMIFNFRNEFLNKMNALWVQFTANNTWGEIVLDQRVRPHDISVHL